MEELFALLRPFLENRVGRVPFPANVSQARAAVQTPFETLKISTIEMCSLGCHRFQENTQVSSCPTCNTPRRLEDGSKTTCTFHKYALKDRLRQLFARPYQVPLLTSHANKVPDHDNMRGVHGTCQPQSMFCEVFILWVAYGSNQMCYPDPAFVARQLLPWSELSHNRVTIIYFVIKVLR